MTARWIARTWVAAWVVCLCGPALAEPGPPDGDLRQRLVAAATRDENEAYVAARAEALELDDKAFGALLDALEETGAWRALAIRDGLEVRRRKPDIAESFDVGLNRVRASRRTRRFGGFVTFEFASLVLLYRDLGRTPEFDALRLDAVLTERADDPALDWFQRGEALVALRRSLLTLVNPTERNMQKMVALLRDPPVWVRIDSVTRHIGRFARSPGLVDPYVSELLDLYWNLREGGQDSRALRGMGSLHDAIGRASPDRALPALKAIREFERTEAMPRDGFEPWAITVEDAQEKKHRTWVHLRDAKQALEKATEEGREEEGNQLAIDVMELRKAHQRSWVAWTAKSLWDTLNEHIKRIENERSVE